MVNPGNSRGFINKLFFVLVVSSESNAWVRAASSNAGLKVSGNPSAFSSGNSDLHLFALNFLVVAMTGVLCFPQLRRLTAMMLHLPAMSLVYGFTAISFIWSADRGNTIRLSIYLILGFFQVVYLSMNLDLDQQIDVGGHLSAAFALLSIVGERYLAPVDDPAPGWAGIFPTKNYLGNIMGLGLILIFLRKGKWTPLRFIEAGLCLVLLVLSQSFTAYVCTLIAISLITFFRIGRSQRILLVITGVGVAILTFTYVPNIFTLALGAGGKSTNLTGRDVIWAFCFSRMKLHPILGFGYSAFWGSESQSAIEFLGWNPGQAHNGFIELLLEEGVVGLVLALVLLVDGLRRGLRQIRSEEGARAGVWVLALTVYLVLHNVSESDFYQRPAWVIYILAYILVARLQLPRRTNAVPLLLSTQEADAEALAV